MKKKKIEKIKSAINYMDIEKVKEPSLTFAHEIKVSQRKLNEIIDRLNENNT